MIPGATASFFLSKDEIDGILDGTLAAFFRKEKMAEPFDIFHIDGRAFFIEGISALELEALAEFAYSEAGFSNTRDFIASLSDSMEGLDSDTTIYTHHVAECGCGNCTMDCKDDLCTDWKGWGWMP